MVYYVSNLLGHIPDSHLCDAISHLKYEKLCVFKEVCVIQVGVQRNEATSRGAGQDSVNSSQHEANGEKLSLGEEGQLTKTDAVCRPRTALRTIHGTFHPL